MDLNFFNESILDDAFNKAAAAKNAFMDDASQYMDDSSLLRNRIGKDAEKINKGVSAANDFYNRNAVNPKSIIARAKNSICQFPMYVTQSIRVNEAQIISKSFERVYATLIQSVLSQNPIIDADDANNLVFLKQFHINLKESANNILNEFYEAIDNFDQMMCDSIFYKENINEQVSVEFRVVPTDNTMLIQECSRLANPPLTGFVYLQEYSNPTPKKREEVSIKEKIRILTDASIEKIITSIGGKRNIDNKQELIEYIKNNKGTIRVGANNDLVIVRNINGKDALCVYDSKNGQEFTNSSSSGNPLQTIDAPKLLHDSDIKKINGMLPYTIEATFRLRLKDGTHDKDVRYIIGIKTIMHLISIKDLSEDLRELITGKQKSLQKVRYTTGEISFKDYMFNIKGLKRDAARRINYNRKWINTLKRLSDLASTKGGLLNWGVHGLNNGETPIPNGTIILSQPDVSRLLNETGIDLSTISNARKLAESLFLIGVVIVDSTAGTLKVFFPDSDTDWDIQSLASIDAEVSRTDNSNLLKELNKVVNK